MSNGLDPGQARQFLGPDLGPNCLQSFSADDTGRQSVKRILGQCRQATSEDPLLVTYTTMWKLCQMSQ